MKILKLFLEKVFKDDIKGSICFILHDYDKEFILSEKFGRILENKKY